MTCLYIIHWSSDSRKRKYFRWRAIYDVLARTGVPRSVDRKAAHRKNYIQKPRIFDLMHASSLTNWRETSFSSRWDNGPWQIRIYTRLFTSDWKRSNVARATFYTPDIFTFIFSGDLLRYFYSRNSAQRLRKQRIRLLAVLCFCARRRDDMMEWLELAIYRSTVVNVSWISDSSLRETGIIFLWLYKWNRIFLFLFSYAFNRYKIN